MTVLILADCADITADAVVRELGDRGVPVFRIDTAWFPAQLSIDAELRGNGWSGRLITPSRQVDLDTIRSVWLRSPTAFRFPAGLSATERRHAHTEAKLGVGGVLASLNALYVNHPSRAADCAYKPMQLSTALRCGLRVPQTLVTNDPAAVRRFTMNADTPVVTKMFGAASLTEEGFRKVAFTRLVDAAGRDDLRGVEVTAHQFQRYVPKAFDARVIAIGADLFAFAIHAHTPRARLDFRNDYGALSYEWIDIPAEVAEGVTRFLAEFGLSYGAFDFVVDPQARWWMLECNAGGQYQWLEAHTGAPLTQTLADMLAKGAP